MLVGALILFGITLLGVLVACKATGYDISWGRKIGAAAAFAALNVIQIPIPFVSFLIPPIALYVILMDDSYQRSQVNQVFGITFIFAIVAVLAIYKW